MIYTALYSTVGLFISPQRDNIGSHFRILRSSDYGALVILLLVGVVLDGMSSFWSFVLTRLPTVENTVGSRTCMKMSHTSPLVELMSMVSRASCSPLVRVESLMI